MLETSFIKNAVTNYLKTIKPYIPKEELIMTALYDKTPDMASYYIPNIKKVILSGRATIILWEDGTKTIVKCAKDDNYDMEKGIAMAILKKYSDQRAKWIDFSITG